MKTYTVILYKSSGCTVCRGCVMEEWGSDFSLDTGVSEESVISQIAEAFSRESLGGYDAHVINVRNGNQVTHNIFTSPGEVHCSTLTDNDDDYDIDIQEGIRLSHLIKDTMKAINDARQEQARKDKQNKQKISDREKELNERAQLKALKEKYENNQKE